MRADAHYVDQLDAPPAITVQLLPVTAIDAGDAAPMASVPSLVDSIKRHGVLEPLIVQKRDRRYRVITGRKRLAAAMGAGLREVPCIVRRVGDDEAQVLATASRQQPTTATAPIALRQSDEETANALSAVLSSTALLTRDTPAFTREVTIEMLRAESQRALCLLRVGSTLRYGVPEARRFVPVPEIVKRVQDLIAPDASLRGASVTVQWSPCERALLRGDCEVLAYSLSAVALVLSKVLDRGLSATIAITASAESPDAVRIAVEHDFVVLPEAWLALPTGSAIDASSSGELMPLLALQKVVEAYGGHLEVARLAHGSRVSVVLPAVHRR
jgi:hypothetical protein